MGLIGDTTRGLLRDINTQARDIDIVIRRGTGMLPAQRVILSVHQGSPAERAAAGGQETRVDGEARGLPSMDVQIGDRFNAGGALFRVGFIRPDRSVATIAEVSIVS